MPCRSFLWGSFPFSFTHTYTSFQIKIAVFWTEVTVLRGAALQRGTRRVVGGREGIQSGAQAGRAPLTLPPPRFPGAREADTGWGTQGALCRGGGRGCARLGAGPAGGGRGGRLILKGALFARALLAPAGGGASASSSPRRPRRGLWADPAPCPSVGARWVRRAEAPSGIARPDRRLVPE